jgi:poly(3-hydroxybutyrate) depolymerase
MPLPLVATLLLLAQGSPSPLAAAPVVSTRHLLVGGHNRSYELQVPPPGAGEERRRDGARLPVIMSFHGDGGTAPSQAADDHFRDVAGGWALVVHGQGIGTEQESGKNHPTWNGGGSSMQSLGPTGRRIAPDGETCQQNITKGTLMASCAKQIGPGASGDPCWWSNCHDDVAYVVAILDQLEQEFAIDVARVFGSGDSNGAMFLYQLIADPRTGDRLAAIAPVAGLPHNGFLFAPTNPKLRYLNVWGERDTYIPALCSTTPATSEKSGPGCCGWFYSCIGNTTRMFAALHNFAQPAQPRSLSAPLAGGAASCRGFSKTGATVATALVVDCSWDGPHGWPRISGGGGGGDDGAAAATPTVGSRTGRPITPRTRGSRWPAEMIVDFFVQGQAPPPPPPSPTPRCPDCGGHTCDGWIAMDPEKYACAELKRDWGCKCHGCKSCPNVTHAPAL